MNESDPNPASQPQASGQPPAPTADGVKDTLHGEQSSHVPVHFSRRTGWHVIVAALALAIALGAIYLLRSHHQAAGQDVLAEQLRQDLETPPTVNVAKVERAASDVPLTLPGECRAMIMTTVFARTSGYLHTWKFDIGDHVEANDVLATIETPELDEQIKVAQAKLDSLHADKKLAQASVDFAKISYDRFGAAAPEGAVSGQEADQKKSELDVALAKLESAKAQVSLGEADLRRLQDLANFKRVTAPFEGIVTQRYIDIGDLVTAGSTTNTTPLFTICRSDQLRVYVDVPQVARPSIRVGMCADVTAREFPGRTFHGKVDRTAESINAASGTLRVEVLVPNPDGALLPGMFASVVFCGQREHPPIRIQASALLLLADGPHVAVVGADGCAHFRPIKIARDLGDIIEISQGLTGDEAIALNISHEITDGQKVTPVVVDMQAKPAVQSAQVSDR